MIARGIAFAALCLLALQARANDLQTTATAGQVADVGSTAVGLAMGAAEANPLGVLTLGAKALVYEQIKVAPPVEQPALWSAYGAFGWGATANNLCVIAAIATGGIAALVCPVIGLATGLATWTADESKRNRETFDAVCAERRREQPDLVCIYSEPEGR